MIDLETNTPPCPHCQNNAEWPMDHEDWCPVSPYYRRPRERAVQKPGGTAALLPILAIAVALTPLVLDIILGGAISEGILAWLK